VCYAFSEGAEFAVARRVALDEDADEEECLLGEGFAGFF